MDAPASLRLQVRHSSLTPPPIITFDHMLTHLNRLSCDSIKPCIGDNMFVIAHMNIQSLRNKMSELEVLLDELPCHIVSLNEHWLNESEISLYVPTSYKLLSYYCRGETGYGGVSLYMQKNVDIRVELLDLESLTIVRDFEVSGVVLIDLKIILVSLYRTPDANISVFKDHFELLIKSLDKYLNHRLIIVGDFNIDVNEDCSNVYDCINLFLSFGLRYLNNLPTRMNACLDNVLTSTEFNSPTCGTFDPLMSDHVGIWLSIQHTPYSKINKSYIIYRSLRTNNLCKLRDHLLMIDFNRIISTSRDVNSAWNLFTSILSSVLSRCCPMIKRHLNESKRPVKKYNGWYNDELASLRVLVFYWFIKAKNDTNYINTYKSVRARYKKAVKKSQIQYNESYIQNSPNMVSSAWNLMKRATKVSTELQVDISPDTFNRHFVDNVFQPLTTDDNIHDREFSGNFLNRQLSNQPFSVTTITPTKLVSLVKKIKISRSEDVFGMSSLVLKHIIDIILTPLVDLINWSVSDAVFPDCLKTSIIVPIYKKGDKQQVDNYRPIALVPIFSKIFEHCVLSQLSSYFFQGNIIHSSQHGFRSGASTISAITELVNSIHDSFEQKNITSAIFLDLSRAFDTISHPILLDKLHWYGVSTNTVNLIRSYLLDRRQIVKFNNTFSSVELVKRGVPQGSVLGPFLFSVYINDFPIYLNCKSILYADDTTLISIAHNLDEIHSLNANTLQLAAKWLKYNELVLNNSKTESMLFSLIPNIISQNQSDCIKVLGITIDPKLTWSNHTNAVCKKIAKNIYLLKRLRQLVSLKYLLVVYYAMIHSHLSYGVALWGNSSGAKNVFYWQKKALRCMLKMGSRDSCREAFKFYGIMTLPCIYIFHCLVYIKSIINNLSTFDGQHNYFTRGCDNLITPRSRLTKLQNSYKINGIRFFNFLPLEIRNLDISSFKGRIKKVLKLCSGYSLQEVEENIRAHYN